jgi:hypothetical protein
MPFIRNLAIVVSALWTVTACGDSAAPGTTANGTMQNSHGGRLGRVGAQEGEGEGVEIEVFAPAEGDRVGLDGVGWFVDLAVDFPGDLRSTGFTRNQLTGPAGHNNIPPMPGVFAPGKDDRFPGLAVLVTTSRVGAGGCQNLAGLFSLTGVTNRTEDETEIWDTWIVGAASFGRHVTSTLYVAEVSDLNHNGVHDDAPNVVEDTNHDGVCDEEDLEALGVDSEVAEVNFEIL